MLVQVTMFPTDKRSDSVSSEVARVIDIIDRSSLPYRLTAMATIIEGEWDEIMAVLNKARKMLRRTHSRVYISMVIDDRKGAKHRLTGKVASVEAKLGRKVRT
jgi:uncharacterized protein (TIGR00106 family)